MKNAEELLSISEGDYTDVNDMWNKFEQGFVSVANNYAPIIQKRMRGINNCSWMNNDIKRDMWQRDYFLKKAHKSNDRESWANYRYYRNRVTSKIKKCKESYNRRVIEENSDDSKAFWKTVKKILPGESKKMSTSLKIGNDVSSDGKTIAFNDHFVGVMRRLICDTGNSVVNTGRNLMSAAIVRTITQHENRPTFRFKEIKLSSVFGQLRGLKIGKATGLDNIPARLLKDSAAVVAKPLTRIINASLQQGKLPCAWKCARVIPLLKKGNALNMDNYRPISVLPVISKLLEREVHKQLTGYLREYKILSPYQYGFRKLHSTEFATLAFADTIRRNIDNGLMTGAVFLDFKKAFIVSITPCY